MCGERSARRSRHAIDPRGFNTIQVSYFSVCLKNSIDTVWGGTNKLSKFSRNFASPFSEKNDDTKNHLKTKAKISGYVVRRAAVAGLSLSALVTLSSAFNLPNSLLTSAVPLRFSGNGPGTLNQARTLSFAERVTYQLAIEDVYWRHRIWPKDNPNPKPLLDAVVSQAELEKKVQDYLRDSEALEDYWHGAITAEQLQAEMDRMAQDTKQPEVLRELFEALENDPFVIAECLARPLLTERLLNNQYERVDHGRGHRTEIGLKEASPVKTENKLPDTVTVPNSGYSLPTIADGANGCADDIWTAHPLAPFKRAEHTAVWTGTEMIVWGGAYTGYPKHRREI